jgi:hypothetical protein
MRNKVSPIALVQDKPELFRHLIQDVERLSGCARMVNLRKTIQFGRSENFNVDSPIAMCALGILFSTS